MAQERPQDTRPAADMQHKQRTLSLVAVSVYSLPSTEAVATTRYCKMAAQVGGAGRWGRGRMLSASESLRDAGQLLHQVSADRMQPPGQRQRQRQV